MSDDRLERLERRVEVLERLMRQVTAGRSGASDQPATPAAEPPGTPGRPPATARAPSPPPSSSLRSSRLQVPLEEWVGQRGLLAVGVVAVILAAAYLLKLAIDRGWVSPLLRCSSGALGGLVLGAIGWRLQPRFRTYGAALLGCGTALIYLSLWAATRLFGLVPPVPAVAGLVLVSLVLAALAFAVNVEALGATAALGALFAPLVVGMQTPDSTPLLVYLGIVGLALGAATTLRRWRMATALVALSYFGLGVLGARDAAPRLVFAYAVLGGMGGLASGLRERWIETRLLAFSGGWALLGIAARHLSPGWLTLAGGIALTIPVWRRALALGRLWPWRPLLGPGADAGEALYFYLSPLLLAWAMPHAAPELFSRYPGLSGLLVALPYLAVGLAPGRESFAAVALAALAAGSAAQWTGISRSMALVLLAMGAGLAGWRSGRRDWGGYALGLLALALAWLVEMASLRPVTAPAFRDTWALVLWLLTLVSSLLAARLLPRDRPGGGVPLVVLAWAGAGGLLLFGVTGELLRLFRQWSLSPETGQLAGGLAVSAWWILFAAGLVLLGFQRNWRGVRLAGLSVAGLALAKVLAVDLSSLSALYRVGSVLFLGLVSLALAYVYHQRGRAGS